MVRRLVPLVALLGMLAAGAAALHAQKAEVPTVIIRVRSIDSLLADTKFLITLAGQKEIADQVEGVIQSMIGPKGLDGIDTKRPFGFYGTVGPDGIDSTGVFLIPVADTKSFLNFMDRLNLNPKEEKGAAGLYRFTPPNSPVDAYFRFGNNYAYLSTHIDVDKAKASVATSAMLAPASIFPTDMPALGVTFRLDRVPNGIKQLFLQQFELKLAEEKNKDEPGETESQKKLKNAMIDEIARHISALVKDGSELSVHFDVNRTRNELATEFNLSGVAGTQLAKDIAGIGQAQSVFAGALGSDSALGFLVRLVLPDEIKKTLGPVLDEGIDEGLKEIKDEARRARGQQFLEALKPTLKSGDVDFAFTLRGPTSNKQYLVLMGMKLQEGAKVEAALQTMLKGEKPEEQARYQWGVDKSGGVAIHALSINKETEAFQQLLGKEPFYFAFRGDALMAAYGDGGLAALKQALAAKPSATTAVVFGMAIQRFEPIVSFTQNEEVGKAVQDAFAGGKDNDVVRFSVEGGKALKARFSIKGQVITFLAKVAELQKNAAQN